MLLSIISSSFTRPADTVAYASGDLVANSGGSGTALTTTQPTMVANFIVRII
jgi:uncharacterized membrane protein (DUF441 family)